MAKSWPLPGQTNEELGIAEKNPQNSLEMMREEIDQIDLQMISLLSKRFELSQKIGRLKTEHGLSIKDSERERQILESIDQKLEEDRHRESIKSIFRSLLKESVEVQERGMVDEETRLRAGRLFPSVCVIGAGLIGGAISRRIRAVFPQNKLFAVDLPHNLQKLEESKLFDESASKLKKSVVSQSSLILLACPPDTSIKILRKLAPMLCPGQLVLDLCSVKGPVCSEIEKLDLKGAEFVGGHPFFGTEKSGFENSGELPLDGRTFCLVPASKSSEISVARLKLWLLSLNLRVFVSEASLHDSTVALTSHLIQLISSSIGSMIHDSLLATGKSEHLALSGGALKSLSRLMKSKPEIWMQISCQNRKNIKASLKTLSCKLNELANAKDGVCFERTFAKAALVGELLDK